VSRPYARDPSSFDELLQREGHIVCEDRHPGIRLALGSLSSRHIESHRQHVFDLPSWALAIGQIFDDRLTQEIVITKLHDRAG
jgi:hypothetical protein